MSQHLGKDLSAPHQQEVLQTVLAVIRLRAKADFHALNLDQSYSSLPATADETAWRKWIRRVTSRAVADLLKFAEDRTGYSSPPTAAASFRRDFQEALEASTEEFLKTYSRVTKLDADRVRDSDCCGTSSSAAAGCEF